MKKIIAAMMLIAVGFAAGWQARELSTRDQPETGGLSVIREAAMDRDRRLAQIHEPPDAVLDTPRSSGSHIDLNVRSAEHNTPDKPSVADSFNRTMEQFNLLLDRKQHSQAMNLYRETEFRDPNAAVELKVLLMKRLRNYLAQGQQEYFTDLVNTYLSSYYNDTEVLLLVAEFNARADYLSETLATYQLIRSYAQGKADRQQAESELNRFISAVDKQHGESGMWYELQIFYELLDQYGLSNARHRFRLAEIYATNGYTELSKDIFQSLLSHPQWGNQAGSRLEAMARDRVPEVSKTAYAEEVPLQSLGEHYLVKAGIGEHDTVNLVIDTGASTTLVSSQAFARLSGYSDFVRLPSRMFNTVNGITRGAVYVVPEFNLGPYRLKDIEVAVVEFEPGANVDGLLGMNVLRNFHFEINQDAVALLLERRNRNN